MIYLCWKLLRINVLAISGIFLATLPLAAEPGLQPGQIVDSTTDVIETETSKLLQNEQSTIPDGMSTVDPESSNAAMEQITSVSQLTDIEPANWAFQALQSLIERYSCIEGDPNGTYLGNRAITRYEFAAGLNACLDHVNELVATGTTNSVNEADLETLNRLQAEFTDELSSLRNRINLVEARATTIDKQRFSTTTRLNGAVLTYLSGAFGETASQVNTPNFNSAVALNLNSSFTGRDVFTVGLIASKAGVLSAGDPNIDNETGGFGARRPFPSDAPNSFSDEARLPISGSAAGGLGSGGVQVYNLSYTFPISDRTRMTVAGAIADPTFLGADVINYFFNSPISGGISLFSTVSLSYYAGGGRSGIGIVHQLSDSLTLSAGYSGLDTGGFTGSPNNPGPTSGIFNGGQFRYGQLTFKQGNLTAGLIYANTYNPIFGIDTQVGSNAAKVRTGGFSTPFDDRITNSNYGITIKYRFLNRLELGGWINYADANVLGVDTEGTPTGNRGDVKVLSYLLTLTFPDLGRKGNVGGVAFGMQSKVVGTSNRRVAAAIGLPSGERQDRDTGFHIEAFYAIQISENIYVTPGFFWLTAPNHDDRNPDAFIGLVRTTFVF